MEEGLEAMSGVAGLGTFRRTGDTVELTFHRRYARPIEKVWAAITVPERISDWFAETRIEGDRIEFYFTGADARVSGRIVICEPMKTVAWALDDLAGAGTGQTIVRIDLDPDGEGCWFTLTESGLQRAQGAANAAGWHAHLEAIEDAADGVRTPWATLLEREKVVNQVYKDRAPQN